MRRWCSSRSWIAAPNNSFNPDWRKSAPAGLIQTLGVSTLRIMRMQQWIFLSVAIVSEVIATSALKASEGFSRLWPSAIVIVGYAAAFCYSPSPPRRFNWCGLRNLVGGRGCFNHADFIPGSLLGSHSTFQESSASHSSWPALSSSICFLRPSPTHEPPNLSFHRTCAESRPGR